MDEQGNKQDVAYRLYEKTDEKVNTLSSLTEIGHNTDLWQESYIRSLMLK